MCTFENNNSKISTCNSMGTVGDVVLPEPIKSQCSSTQTAADVGSLSHLNRRRLLAFFTKIIFFSSVPQIVSQDWVLVFRYHKRSILQVFDGASKVLLCLFSIILRLIVNMFVPPKIQIIASKPWQACAIWIECHSFITDSPDSHSIYLGPIVRTAQAVALYLV